MKRTHAWQKVLAAVAMAASVFGMNAGSVMAADANVSATWDRSQVGHIRISYTEDSKTDNSETPVIGAEFTAYKIADVTIFGGTEIHRRTEQIPVGSKLRSIIPGVRFDYDEDTADKTTLEDSQDRDINDYVVHVDTDAVEYQDIVQAAYSKNPQLEDGFVTSGTTDSNGNLDLAIPSKDFGAYMVVESRPADGYDASMPFVCAVPFTSEDGTSWEYTVTAEPKAIPHVEETTTTPPAVETPSTPNTPSVHTPNENHNTPAVNRNVSDGKGVAVKETWDSSHIGLLAVIAACAAAALIAIAVHSKKNKKA